MAAEEIGQRIWDACFYTDYHVEYLRAVQEALPDIPQEYDLEEQLSWVATSLSLLKARLNLREARSLAEITDNFKRSLIKCFHIISLTPISLHYYQLPEPPTIRNCIFISIWTRLGYYAYIQNFLQRIIEYHLESTTIIREPFSEIPYRLDKEKFDRLTEFLNTYLDFEVMNEILQNFERTFLSKTREFIRTRLIQQSA